MTRTSQNGRECICHGKLAVVVTMNTDWNIHLLCHEARNAFHVERQTPSIRVAEHDARRTGLSSDEQRFQRILGIRSIAIKEVLRVINHKWHSRRKVTQRVSDDLEILFETDSQGLANVQLPRLAENSNNRSIRFDQRLNTGIGFARKTTAPRGAKCSDARMTQLQRTRLVEKRNIARI